MTKLTLNIDVSTDAETTPEAIAEVLRRLIARGLEDAKETIESGEGDLDAAKFANDLTIFIPPVTFPPRVLVIIEGGVAENWVCDAGVEVEIFDRDNYGDDPQGTGGVSPHFADLAEQCNVPVGEYIRTENMAKQDTGVATEAPVNEKWGFVDTAGTFYPNMESIRTYLPAGREYAPVTPTLVLVHPGSACSPAMRNLGGAAAVEARAVLSEELRNWTGGLIVLQDEFHEELQDYPELQSAIDAALRRAEQGGLTTIYREAPDPEQGDEVQAIVRDFRPTAHAFVVTGARYESSDGASSIDLVLNALRAMNLKTEVSDSVVDIDHDIVTPPQSQRG